MRVADRLKLSLSQQADVYYTSLLMHAGCTAGSPQFAAYLASDELVAQRDLCLCDPYNFREVMGCLWSHASPGSSVSSRGMHFLALLMQGEKAFAEVEHGCSDVGSTIAGRLRLPEATRQSLFQICDTWGGKGPHKLRRDDIPLPTRIVNAAMVFEVFFSTTGQEAAIQAATKRREKSFDPQVVDALRSLSADDPLWQDLKHDDLWGLALSLEPEPRRYIGDRDLDDVASSLADFVDLKNSRVATHSRNVACLAEGMARRVRLPEPDVVLTRRAALVHALGQIAVPAHVLNKEGPLTTDENEKLRLHPYYTERITARSPALQAMGRIGAMHHERLDGSGYPQGLSGDQVPMTARIVALADAFQELTEDRPGKPAQSTDDAQQQLERESGTKFDPVCLAALSQETGGSPARAPTRVQWPGGLTDREVEVLRLVSRGLTSKEMAKALVVSESTARHHLEHIYAKAGVTSRAGAVMFAAENGLLL